MTILDYAPVLAQGVIMTLTAWIIASCASLCIGTCLGIISCHYLNLERWRLVCKGYIFIAKGIPAYVHILLAYFVLPALLGLKIPALCAAVGALIFCSSGYVAEIVRSGMNAVARGQWDACFVLGYPLGQTLMRIILPQAFTNVLPALCGESEQLLKSTSLLATIGITELTRVGMNIISRELNPIPVYLSIALIYLLLSALLHLCMVYLEKKIAYGYR